MAKVSKWKQFVNRKMKNLDREYNSMVRKANELKVKRARAEARVEALIEKQNALETKIEANLDAWHKWNMLGKGRR